MENVSERRNNTVPDSLDYEQQLERASSQNARQKESAEVKAPKHSAIKYLIVLKNALRFICRPVQLAASWFARNHQGLSSLIVVIGLPATIFSLWLTRVQMNTAQSNFKEEMSVQRKSTAAVLFNDFLKDIRVIESESQSVAGIDKRTMANIATRANFIIQGIGDSHLRSLVLSYIATKYADELIEMKLGKDGMGREDQQPIRAINLSDRRYSGSIEGNLKNTTIANASFRGVAFSDVDFSKSGIRYSDFSESTFYGGVMNAVHLNCVSFNGALFRDIDSFAGSAIRFVDFRNIDVVSSGGNTVKKKSAVVSLIATAASVENILVDNDVKSQLLEAGVAATYSDEKSQTDSFFNTEKSNQSNDWLASVKASEACG